MSDGRRAAKSDVVILSIKPRRPEFSPKKHVPVKVALDEWDKLDAYYRGQILKLKHKVKSEAKKSDKSSSNNQGNKDHKKSSSLPRRRSTSGHQLTELFGDENIPFGHHQDEGDPSHQGGSDEENRRPIEHRHRSSSKKHRDGHKTKIKSENLFTTPPPKSQEKEKEQDDKEDDNNFLSIPRDNFVIEFVLGEKKRTPIHRPDSPGFISPVKVEPYKVCFYYISNLLNVFTKLISGCGNLIINNKFNPNVHFASSLQLQSGSMLSTFKRFCTTQEASNNTRPQQLPVQPHRKNHQTLTPLLQYLYSEIMVKTTRNNVNHLHTAWTIDIPPNTKHYSEQVMELKNSCRKSHVKP